MSYVVEEWDFFIYQPVGTEMKTDYRKVLVD